MDNQRVILRMKNDDADSAYVNTEAGADYINASYLDVRNTHRNGTLLCDAVSCRDIVDVMHSLLHKVLLPRQ